MTKANTVSAGWCSRGWDVDLYLRHCFSLAELHTPWFSTEVPSIQDSRTRHSHPRMPLGPQVSPVSGEKLGPCPRALSSMSLGGLAVAYREGRPRKVV